MNELNKIEEFKPIIKSLAKKYCDENNFEDLIVVGEIACIKFINSFDEKKKTKLSTYLYSKIEGAMRDEIKTKYNYFGRKNNNKPISLSEIENVLSYSIEELLLKRSDNEELRKIIDSLSIKEKRILQMKYWENKTFVKIAEEFDSSDSRISQIHQNILKKLSKKVNK